MKGSPSGSGRGGHGTLGQGEPRALAALARSLAVSLPDAPSAAELAAAVATQDPRWRAALRTLVDEAPEQLLVRAVLEGSLDSADLVRIIDRFGCRNAATETRLRRLAGEPVAETG